MGRVVDIPWVLGRYIMGRRVHIPWIEGLIYHGYGGQYTKGRGVDILWVGGRYAIDRESKCHGWGSIYHG